MKLITGKIKKVQIKLDSKIKKFIIDENKHF